MKDFQLISAFERWGIKKADYFQFRKLIVTGGRVQEGDFSWRLMTTQYKGCLNEILGILTTRAA